MALSDGVSARVDARSVGRMASIEGTCRHEGQGIGTALLEQCCRDLERAGHRSASLHTVAATRAEAFYRARGWVLDDATDPRNLLYRKALRGAP